MKNGFLVFSGFLGSGKTSMMIALSKELEARGLPAATISNDLGARGFVDTYYSKACGCDATELSGACICYQTKNLVDRLRRVLESEGHAVAMSDIPGFGVGALEHVYHKLNDCYPGEFQLLPFTAVTDLRCVQQLQTGTGEYPEELLYIFRRQLDEAEVILLNKSDLMDDAACDSALQFLREGWKDAAVFAVSAKTGAGVDAFADYILSHTSRLLHPDLAYGGPDFCAAMGKMAQFGRQFYVEVCCNTFDANAYLRDLAEAIRKNICAAGGHTPHLKLFAMGADGAYAKLSAVGSEGVLTLDHGIDEPVTALPVVINTSAVCPADKLNQAMDGAIAAAAEKYNLSVTTYMTECFGIGGPGRL